MSHPSELEPNLVSTQFSSDLWLPEPCWNDISGQGPHAILSEDGQWRCRKCGKFLEEQAASKGLSSAEALLGRLAELHFFKPEVTPAVGFSSSVTGMMSREYMAYAVDLVGTVWGILGMQHWASQWARLLVIDMAIARMGLGVET